MFRFRSIDPSTLVTVSGGQAVSEERTDGLNTDVRQSRLGVWWAGGRIPLPYRVNSTQSTRTPFGNCVDSSNQQCERDGGGNAVVGACKLDGIDLCTRQQQP
jgi:hypothetical protein